MTVLLRVSGHVQKGCRYVDWGFDYNTRCPCAEAKRTKCKPRAQINMHTSGKVTGRVGTASSP